MYTVKQAAALTGVAEATLRMWERRYGVVRPERSSGGYRLYDDAQLARLREMAALVADGVPASRAAAALASKQPPDPEPPGMGRPDDAALVDAAISLDPARLTAVIDQAFSSGPFEDVADGWLMPQLRLVGLAWEAGRLSVAHEHFVSAGLMRAMAAVYAAASPTTATPVLIGLPAGERHELALFAFATCLARRGTTTVYLGADVPADAWAQAVATRRPRAAVIGVSRAAVPEAQRLVDELSREALPLSIWVGGSAREAVTGARILPESVAEAAALLHLSLAAGSV